MVMQIGIWGDSITYGGGDLEALGWVGRLRKFLDEKNFGEVYNFGVCGDDSEGLLKRFSVEATSIKPAIVVFSIGINDSKYLVGSISAKVSLQQFEKNMSELLRQAKRFTQQVFVVSATNVIDDVETAAGSRFNNSDIQKYNALLKVLSAQERVEFIDVYGALDTGRDFFDGVHPNTTGYQKLFEILKNRIK